MTTSAQHPSRNSNTQSSPPYGYGADINSRGGPPETFDKPSGWLAITWVFLWPLAVYSLLSAWRKIDPALIRGDVAGARFLAGRVKGMGILALCIGVVLGVVLFVELMRLEAQWLEQGAGCTHGHSC